MLYTSRAVTGSHAHRTIYACLDLYRDLVGNHERGFFFFHFCAKRFQTFLHTLIAVHTPILIITAFLGNFFFARARAKMGTPRDEDAEGSGFKPP